MYAVHIGTFPGQYTTGRGSSGVGLTAAVMKDPVTGEMTLGTVHVKQRDYAVFIVGEMGFNVYFVQFLGCNLRIG